MKRLLLIFVCFLAFNVHAQLWCPPGAIWTYNLQSFIVEGCETRQYVGDTVLDGWAAQRIEVTSIRMNYMTSTLDTTVAHFFTRQEDDVVSTWNAWGGNTGWDTLYWFGAVPGDRWYPPGADGLCVGLEPWGMLEVSDTGHVVINGEDLRYVDVSYLDQSGEPGTDGFRITERLGAPLMMIYPGGCFVSEAGGGLRTYSDASFPLYDTGEQDLCDQFTGYSGPISPLQFGIAPNPGSDHLTITLGPATKGTFSIIDPLGRTIAKDRPANGPTTMDTSCWPSGIFHIVVFDGRGGRRSARWIKQ